MRSLPIHLTTLLLYGIALTQADDTRLETLLTGLGITPDMLDKLGSGDNAAVTATVAEILRKHLNKKGISLDITPEEARFSQNMANQCQDQTSCGCRLETRNVQLHAAIKKPSSFSTNNELLQDAGMLLGK